MSRAEAPRLRRVQRLLLADSAGLRALSPAGRARLLAEPPAGSLERRWHVYTSGYLARLVEALEIDYPALRRILGGHAFGSLTARYVRAHPPESHDIGQCGSRLPRFLEADPLREELPFLPDLARLEWALAEAFVARDERPLSLADLAAAVPEQVADWRLRLVAGATLLRSRWPLVDLWRCQALPDEAVSIPVEGRPCDALVLREGFETRPAAISGADAAFLEAVAAGTSLARLAEEAADSEESDALVARFRAWVQAGALVHVEEPAPVAAP